jgi:hypothetical protein
VRFYEYSLGSAREARDWYYKGRHILGLAVVNHRLELLTEVIRLLLTMIPEQRSVMVREDQADYITAASPPTAPSATSNALLETLLTNVPLPEPTSSAD